MGETGPLEAKSSARAPKIDPPRAPGRAFNLKCRSCCNDRCCKLPMHMRGVPVADQHNSASWHPFSKSLHKALRSRTKPVYVLRRCEVCRKTRQKRLNESIPILPVSTQPRKTHAVAHRPPPVNRWRVGTVLRKGNVLHFLRWPAHELIMLNAAIHAKHRELVAQNLRQLQLESRADTVAEPLEKHIHVRRLV